MIVRNSARCLECDTEIESVHRHDCQTCACGNVFVDGGKTYLRRGVRNPSTYMDTSISAPDPDIETEQ
jgi:hypothetical protein